MNWQIQLKRDLNKIISLTLRKRLEKLISSGQLLYAVQTLHKRTHLGLRESKYICDDIREEIETKQKEHESRR